MAAVGGWFATRSSGQTASTQLVAAALGAIQQTVTATGTVAAASQANLNFAVSGRVAGIDVSVGQAVAPGQPLARLDPTALDAQVAQAEATLAAAQVRRSADQSAGASATQLNADDAAVTAAKSQLNSAQAARANATLTSTIAGTVAAVNLTIGQQVSAGGGGSGAAASAPATGGACPTGAGAGGTGAGGAGAAGGSVASTSSPSSSSSSSAHVVVIDTSAFIVNAAVDGTQIGQVKEGDQAVITPQGASTPVYGKVRTVGLVATQTSGVATFPVVIDVTGSPSGLYAGSTANLTIVVRQLNNVVTVPSAALRFSDSGDTVVVDKDGKQSTRAVAVGVSGGARTQIVNGLQPGEQVVVRTVRASRAPATGGGTRPGGFGGFGGGGGGFGGAGGGRAGGGAGARGAED